MSIATNLALAVTNDLKEQFDSENRTVSLSLVPRTDIKALHGKTLIMVCPRSVKTESDTRLAGAVYRVSIDVGIMRQCPIDNGDISDLTDQVEDVLSFLRRKTLSDFPQAKWVSAENKPIYDVSRLLNEATFFSVITFDYLVRGV